MITEVLGSAPGSYALAVVAGIGLGLVFGERSKTSAVGAALMALVFVTIVATHFSHAFLAGPVFVLSAAAAAVARDVHAYADSPLLADTRYPQRFLLMLVHGKKIRAAADLARSS